MRFWKRGHPSTRNPGKFLRWRIGFQILPWLFFSSHRLLGSWTEAECGKKEKFASGLDLFAHRRKEENPKERGWCRAAITVRSVWLFPSWSHSQPRVGSGFFSPLKPVGFPGGSGSSPADSFCLGQGFSHGRAAGCIGTVSPTPGHRSPLGVRGGEPAPLPPAPTSALAAI